MAKKARKTSTAKKVKRAKLKRPRAKKAAHAKTRRSKPPAGPAKTASAFQIMIDKINETERMRAKNGPRGSDETD